MNIRKIKYKEIPEHCEPIVACIGYFDGMHIGHAELVRKTLVKANQLGIKSSLITFEPDPWCVLKGMCNLPHLTSMQERIAIGEQFGLQDWIVIEFDTELASLPYLAFESEILAKLNVQCLICGFDYHYGAKGEGSITTLKQQDFFDVEVVEAVLYKEQKISSTRIEKLIEAGDIADLNNLLGRPFSISGKVTSGKAFGRSYGYPTANCKLDYNYILPKNGVYIGYTFYKGKNYRSMINVGHNPSFNYTEKVSVEAFLLDFNEDMYEQEISIIFIKRLRDEMKFNSSDELVSQIDKDAQEAYKLKA